MHIGLRLKLPRYCVTATGYGEGHNDKPRLYLRETDSLLTRHFNI